MKKIEILVGSTLGAAEYVADHLQEKLAADNIQSNIHLHPQIDDLLKEPNSFWLICTSTHGAGEPPENIKEFYQSLTTGPALSGKDKEFVVVALGSKDYDQFCEAGKNFQRILIDLGAKEVGSSLFIDTIQDPIPEDRVDLWYPEWFKSFK